MRQFAQKGFNIERLSTESKVVYTTFLVFSIAALAVSALYYAAITDNKPIKGAETYYAGSPPAASAEEMAMEQELEEELLMKEGLEDGPAIELPDDFEEVSGRGLIVPMTARKLLEVTHFHLFTIPVFLLIITHIFMLCSLSSQTKLSWILSGVISTAAHMAAPWVVYLGGASAGWLMAATGTWMTLSMLVLCLWPVYFMWRTPQAGGHAVG